MEIFQVIEHVLLYSLMCFLILELSIILVSFIIMGGFIRIQGDKQKAYEDIKEVIKCGKVYKDFIVVRDSYTYIAKLPIGFLGYKYYRSLFGILPRKFNKDIYNKIKE